MNKNWLIVFTAAALAMVGDAAWGQDFCQTPIQTGQGLIAGFQDKDYEACVYRGIPFAQPPVGELRLRRPLPPLPHSGVFEAESFGPACIQTVDLLSGGEAEAYGEDCLYLNVWRPVKPGKFPVMVWIYGGGFVGGAGSFDIYDGAHLALREDVVVVTINYRLGALGFLALPGLKAEDEAGMVGNYGALDQVRALEWVRDHIAAFGGDPQNVTVFGQSAGAMSVCALLAAPSAQGLFHRGMMMSGPCRLMTELEPGYDKGEKFAAALGCDAGDLDCLRAVPAAAFNQKAPNDLFAGGVAWSPTIDGSYLPAAPIDIIRAGQSAQVPLIIGTTRDELRMYTITVPGLGTLSRGAVNELMKALTGDNYNAIMAMYDYRDYRRPIDLAFAFGNQMVFETPSFFIAEAISPHAPVHFYRFDFDQTRMPHKMGAFHAIDVPFVFGALNADLDLAKLLASKKTYAKYAYLSYIMMDYVGNFARTGDPNGPDLPDWPAYSPDDRQRLYVNTEITSAPLTDRDLERYHWYIERTVPEVLAGWLSRSLAKEK